MSLTRAGEALTHLPSEPVSALQAPLDPLTAIGQVPEEGRAKNETELGQRTFPPGPPDKENGSGSSGAQSSSQSLHRAHKASPDTIVGHSYLNYGTASVMSSEETLKEPQEKRMTPGASWDLSQNAILEGKVEVPMYCIDILREHRLTSWDTGSLGAGRKYTVNTMSLFIDDIKRSVRSTSRIKIMSPTEVSAVQTMGAEPFAPKTGPKLTLFCAADNSLADYVFVPIGRRPDDFAILNERNWSFLLFSRLTKTINHFDFRAPLTASRQGGTNTAVAKAWVAAYSKVFDCTDMANEENRIILRVNPTTADTAKEEHDSGPLMVFLIRAIVNRMQDSGFRQDRLELNNDELEREYRNFSRLWEYLDVEDERSVQQGWVFYTGDASMTTLV